MYYDYWTWVAIALALSQSAILSGLNLAYFSVSRLRLQLESAKGNVDAQKMLALRQDANFLLTTILWSNVAVNVLLALLCNSVMAGVWAFFFSTFGITIIGEIIPQAYFSRHAIRVAALLHPLLRFYRILFYPVAKPSAWLLGKLVGDEAVSFFHERDLYELIKLHMHRPQSEIGKVEGIGAMNFLMIDDLPIANEGRPVNIHSVISLPSENGRPIFPIIVAEPNDSFLKQIHRAAQRWIVITDEHDNPLCLLDADSLLKDIFFVKNPKIADYCRNPVIIRQTDQTLGSAIKRFKIDDDRLYAHKKDINVILVWTPKNRRIITGKELLAKLLHGIVQ